MFPVRLHLLLPGLIVVGAFCAGAAQAQTDPVPPSTGAIPQAAAAQTDSVDAEIAAWTKAPVASSNGGDNGVGKDGVVEIPPRQIHGEAGVSFGSSGYRAGYITTDIPIGKNSDLGLAVGESEIKPKHFGTIRNQTIAISLNIGGAGDQSAPINCRSPTVAMDGRYLEPVWESRLHGEAMARDQLGCDAAAASRAPASSSVSAHSAE